MDELTEIQLDELRADLVALHAGLTELLAATVDATAPVDLDEPIGRLSRMDAIQQQKMAEANRRSSQLRFQHVCAAMSAIERGEYGDCRECEEPIGYRRLKAKPESLFCVGCQSARERR